MKSKIFKRIFGVTLGMVCLIAFILSIFTQGFTDFSVFRNTGIGASDIYDGMTLSGFFNKGVSLRALAVPVHSGGADNGDGSGNETEIETATSSRYILEATVLPESAIDKSVTWVAEWMDESSAWASGKSVNSYVTVIPDSENGNKAAVQCKAPFGAQIKVTAESNYDSTVSAYCTVDYVQKITETSFIGTPTWFRQNNPNSGVVIGEAGGLTRTEDINYLPYYDSFAGTGIENFLNNAANASLPPIYYVGDFSTETSGGVYTLAATAAKYEVYFGYESSYVSTASAEVGAFDYTYDSAYGVKIYDSAEDSYTSYNGKSFISYASVIRLLCGNKIPTQAQYEAMQRICALRSQEDFYLTLVTTTAEGRTYATSYPCKMFRAAEEIVLNSNGITFDSSEIQPIPTHSGGSN